MYRTIRTKRSSKSPPGDTRRLCSYCGVAWYRSQLVRDRSGNLACPDDQKGRDVVTLTEGNLEWLASRRMPGSSGMPTDGTVDSPSTDVAPPVSWNAPNAAPINGGPTGALSVITSLWLRADVVQLGTNGVARWIDQSTRNNHLMAFTTSGQPTYTASDATLNGVPTVTADGVNHFLQGNDFKPAAPLWVWFIMRQNGWTLNNLLFSGGYGVRQRTVTPNLALLTNGLNTDNTGGAIGTWFRGIAMFNVATVDTLQIGPTTVSDASSGQRAGSGFSLFSGFNGSGKTASSCAEMLVTAGVPTASEIAAIDAYGRARYAGALF